MWPNPARYQTPMGTRVGELAIRRGLPLVYPRVYVDFSAKSHSRMESLGEVLSPHQLRKKQRVMAVIEPHANLNGLAGSA